MNLGGQWQMRELPAGEWICSDVPGSVAKTLMKYGQMPDPFWRNNEALVRDFSRKSYELVHLFSVSTAFLHEREVELVCEGIDTLSDIRLNGVLLASTDNMHRVWRLPCSHLLSEGKNEIRIQLFSPLAYIENYEAPAGKEISFSACGAMKGNQYIRKAHSMFGWDWGYQVPDAGIWRDIYLESHAGVRLDEVEVLQSHVSGSVELTVHTTLHIFSGEKNEYDVEVCLEDPDGGVLFCETLPQRSVDSRVITVTNPRLWWPNDYGDSPLYRLSVRVLDDDENIEKVLHIGLRTLTVSQEKDEWGSEFAFVVNGVKIFAKGANYIPEETIYPYITTKKQKHLIDSCVDAHFNMLRVWGGGYYPSDTFYSYCDEAGIIIWQDLMFACNVYDLTDDLARNIEAEVKDNVRRLRHHACLGLWCGNNEIESGWDHWPEIMCHSDLLRQDYIAIFEDLLPKTVAACDQQTFYWYSSPSSGGHFDAPDDENRGDSHCWDVWHGRKPFMEYCKHFFRFCSEFGFESFPCMKTIETFSLPEDRNIFSKVMEGHQKNGTANEKILYYISEQFLYPKNFESLVYVSGIMQAAAIKTGVEHWRRHRGRCMGSLYWQLNDNGPVASWSSIDYFGRWKALHYMARNFYAPVAISVVAASNLIAVYAVNDSLAATQIRLVAGVKDFSFQVLAEKEFASDIPAASATEVFKQDYSSLISGREERVFFYCRLLQNDRILMEETHLFVPDKYAELPKTNIKFQMQKTDTEYEIILRAKKYARYVALDFLGYDAIFSDNYFDITSDAPMRIRVKQILTLGSQEVTADQLSGDLSICSLSDSY